MSSMFWRMTNGLFIFFFSHLLKSLSGFHWHVRLCSVWAALYRKRIRMNVGFLRKNATIHADAFSCRYHTCMDLIAINSDWIESGWWGRGGGNWGREWKWGGVSNWGGKNERRGGGATINKRLMRRHSILIFHHLSPFIENRIFAAFQQHTHTCIAFIRSFIIFLLVIDSHSRSMFTIECFLRSCHTFAILQKARAHHISFAWCDHHLLTTLPIRVRIIAVRTSIWKSVSFSMLLWQSTHVGKAFPLSSYHPNIAHEI